MKYCKPLFAIILTLSILFIYTFYPSNVSAETLFSRYAALIDAESGRLLYGKNENTAAAMASTTKIMTLVTALEICPPDMTVTVSPYAASMPDVQLNAYPGEQFRLEDLYYSLMLESHNDSAVIIAENAAYFYLCNNNDERGQIDFIEKYDNNTTFISKLTEEESMKLVSIFIGLMNSKAKNLNLTDTLFITPNGLDAENEYGFHHTTAYELALIMSYCIENDDFLNITQTKSYTITDLSGGKVYQVNNKNILLDPQSGLISGKTGFTSKSGYCYVCAYKDDERTICIAILGCGWPPQKNKKWSDTRFLLALVSKYNKRALFDGTLTFYIPVNNGKKDLCRLSADLKYEMLLCDEDKVSFTLILPEKINAPVHKSQTCGKIDIYINDKYYSSSDLLIADDIPKKSFFYNFFKNHMT